MKSICYLSLIKIFKLPSFTMTNDPVYLKITFKIAKLHMIFPTPKAQ